MPKATAKYSSALALAKELGISEIEVESQELLYRTLNHANYFWNSDRKKWTKSQEPANPPTKLVRIRITCDSDSVEDIAHEIRFLFLDAMNYELANESKPYVQRPPDQTQSAIYLSFYPKE